MTPLPRAFYARNAEAVARELLGAVLVHSREGLEQRVRLTETEAYLGTHDLACHASKGRTQRTEVMFGEAGHAYVYLIYGMYDMLNIVTGETGEAQAVLIRAAEPLQNVSGKTDGPGKLTRALGITRKGHNGMDLCGSELYLEPDQPPRAVVTTPRVGVAYAGDWKDAPLRFYDADSTYVSKPKR
jgi:DNA-3-methyladenine glycosylase